MSALTTDWPTHEALPVHGWFLACRSAALRRGRVLGVEFAGQPLALWRGEDGQPRALASHCPHMGARLEHGTVCGNALRCALHHRCFSGDGKLSGGAQADAPPMTAQSFRVEEKHGGVWVGTAEANVGCPTFEGLGETDLAVHHGRAVFIRCPWQAVLANAFDLQHFEVVHERRLVGQPIIGPEDNGTRLRFRYVSQVTGRGLADRAMAALSGNRIDVTIDCWNGPVLTVRTRTKRRESFLWLSCLPVGGGTLIKPVFGVPAGRGAALRARLAGWLFLSFLSKDISLLDGMQFKPRFALLEDPFLSAYLSFIRDRTRHSLTLP